MKSKKLSQFFSPKEDEKTSVFARVSPELKNQVSQKLKKEGRTLNELIEASMKMYLSEGQPQGRNRK